jgi:chaperone required for assembly of F1-ATPase
VDSSAATQVEILNVYIANNLAIDICATEANKVTDKLPRWRNYDLGLCYSSATTNK